MTAPTTTDMAKWMADPDTWDVVADAIGHHPYEYNLDDRSHRVDVVQIVMSAAAKLLRA